MTWLDVVVAVGLVAAMAAYAIFFEQPDRAEQLSDEQENAAFAAAVDAGQGLAFAQQRIDSFVTAAPSVYWMLGALAVLEGRSAGVPWGSCLAGAAGFVILSLLAMRPIDRRASRAAAAVLIALAVGLCAFVLRQSSGQYYRGGAAWPRILFMGLIAALPGLHAVRLTVRYHRLRRGGQCAA